MPSQRIILGIGLAILLVIGAASIGLDLMSRSDTASVDRALGILSKISDMRPLLRRAESAARAFAISGDPEFAKEYRETSDAILPALAALIEAVMDDPTEKQLIEETNALVERQVTVNGELIRRRIMGDAAAVAALVGQEDRAATAAGAAAPMRDPMPQPAAAQPAIAEWRSRGTDALAGGSVMRLADGRFDVRFKLWDVVKGVDLGGQSNAVAPDDLRLAAHRIADYIHEKLTGEKGVFSTRIAYVTRGGGRYTLRIADADGEGGQVALNSPEPIISPAWSPDGRELAYVSFESQKAVVYTQEVASGKRRAIANAIRLAARGVEHDIVGRLAQRLPERVLASARSDPGK